eukprot:gene15886-18879_t
MFSESGVSRSPQGSAPYFLCMRIPMLRMGSASRVLHQPLQDRHQPVFFFARLSRLAIHRAVSAIRRRRLSLRAHHAYLTINQQQGGPVKPEQAYCRRTQLLWGVLLIAIGAIILLDRLDVIILHDYYALWHYWPVIMALFGLNKLLAPVSAKQVLSGLWLIFFAAWWYVSYEELWNLSFYNSWPALLIAWGVGLVIEPLPSMKNKPPLHSPSQIVLGVIVIGLGLLFLLDNLGFISVRYTFRFWPTALIVFGLLKLSQSRSANGYLLGGMLVLLGLVWTLKHMGIFYMNWDMLWPLLIIGLGVAVVSKSLPGAQQRQRRRRFAARQDGGAQPDAFGQARNDAVSLDKEAVAAASGTDGAADDDSIIEVTAILGGYVRRVSSQRFKGGDINVIMAGCEIDLRQASIEGEAVLNVFAMCGGITIKIPPDWSVVLQGTPILGGFEEKTIVPPNQDKRLYVTGYAIMGGLEIRN